MMVFGVEEYHAMRGIERYYGRRRTYVGTSMYDSTNYCSSLIVVTDYFTRIGAFSSFRYVYSPNYAVVTLSIYREYLEMGIPWNSWLVNRVQNNDRITFYLNGSIEPMYEVSTTIKVDHRVISITQALNYHYNHNNQSTSPTPISLVF